MKTRADPAVDTAFDTGLDTAGGENRNIMATTAASRRTAAARTMAAVPRAGPHQCRFSLMPAHKHWILDAAPRRRSPPSRVACRLRSRLPLPRHPARGDPHCSLEPHEFSGCLAPPHQGVERHHLTAQGTSSADDVDGPPQERAPRHVPRVSGPSDWSWKLTARASGRPGDTNPGPPPTVSPLYAPPPPASLITLPDTGNR